jgi:putative ABC transport system permease protein
MLGHYLLVVLRNVRRAPAATFTKLLVLSLGLTCFLLAYSVVSYWDHAEQGITRMAGTYVLTTESKLRGGIDSGAFPRIAGNDVEKLKLAFSEFETVARAREAGENPVVAGNREARLYTAYADPDFLEIFDLPFIAGEPENALTAPQSAIITRQAATRLFGTTDVLGKTFRYNGVVDLTVTGVIDSIPEPSHMGRSAASLLRFDVLASWDVGDYVFKTLTGSSINGNFCLAYVVLPKEGAITPESLTPRLAAFAENRIPPTQRDRVDFIIGMMPIGQLMASRLNTVLFNGTELGISISALLMALGTLVLLVACINYANLVTAHATRRAKEVGLRKVVGASRRQIMTQYLIEAGLLSTVSLALAVAMAVLAAPVIHAAIDINVSQFLLSSTDFWLFSLASVALTTCLAGAYPAFILSQARPLAALQANEPGGRRRILPAILVGIQFATTSFLLIGFIVMYEQSQDLRRTGLGTNANPLIVVSNTPALTGVNSKEFEDRLQRLPMVKAVAGMREAPWTGPGQNGSAPTMTLQVKRGEPSSILTTVFNGVDYDFFSTMNIPLAAGRLFDPDRQDNTFGNRNSDTPGAIVVDEAFAHEAGFSSARAAVGQLIYRPVGSSVQSLRIIGVVKNRPLYFAGDWKSNANIYYLSGQLDHVVIRLDGSNIPAALTAVHQVWSTLAPGHVFQYDFEDQLFAEGYSLFGRLAQVLGVLALLATLIAAIGLIGMAGHMTGRRLHEIGVRKTLGANTGRIVAMLLKDFARPVVVANLVAWPFAYIAAKAYLGVFLHRIALTPWPFALSLAVTLLIAWICVGFQSWRAARVKPAKVLRYE